MKPIIVPLRRSPKDSLPLLRSEHQEPGMEPGSAEAVHRKKASSLEKLWMSKGEFALLFSFFLVYIMRVLYTKIKADRGGC
jgi:hypothetical protein